MGRNRNVVHERAMVSSQRENRLIPEGQGCWSRPQRESGRASSIKLLLTWKRARPSLSAHLALALLSRSGCSCQSPPSFTLRLHHKPNPTHRRTSLPRRDESTAGEIYSTSSAISRRRRYAPRPTTFFALPTPPFAVARPESRSLNHHHFRYFSRTLHLRIAYCRTIYSFAT